MKDFYPDGSDQDTVTLLPNCSRWGHTDLFWFAKEINGLNLNPVEHLCEILEWSV